jgi:murein DD-endopeptidase MepM/ murein hydrolase activator NlpD
MWLQNIRYFISTFLWFFLNPFGLWQGMAQVLGQAVAVIHSPIVNPTRPQDLILMSLPFEGYWTVAKGGVNKTDSHSWSVIAQRYAYDFYVTDNDGRSHRDNGKRLEDYYAFGKAVLAPADGTVVEVRDDVRDFPHPGTGWIDWRTRDFRGNYIIIRHGKHVYSFIAHLKQGTCRVKRGDLVQCGQVIGECGNSGHSTEPHIHFHLQNHPNFYLAIGLPIQFRDIGVQGTGSDNVGKYSLGYISKSQKVANLPNDQGVAWRDKEVAKVSYTTNFLDLISSLALCVLTILGIFTIFRALAGVAQSILRLMLGI